MVEQFEQKCLNYEEWLDEGEKALNDCGPIGADLERLVVQEEILEVSRRVLFDVRLSVSTGTSINVWTSINVRIKWRNNNTFTRTM